MFDDLIDIVSLRNMFVPVTSFFEDLVRGPSVYFIVNTYAGHTLRQVRHMLEREGIHVWGDMYDGQVFFFSVEEADRDRAVQILLDNEVGLIEPKPEQASPGNIQLPQTVSQCDYCGSWDVRNGKCNNCGGI